MDKKTLRFVAGAAFALNCIIRLITYFTLPGSVGVWSYIWPIAYLLIAVSLFVDLPILTTVGGIVLTIGAVRSLVVMMPRIVPYILVETIAFLLLVFVGLSRKAAKPLCLLSAILYLAYILMSMLGSGYGLTIRTILLTALFLIGVVLMGISLSATDSKEETAPKSATGDKLDRLIKLKDLLDKGILTQEEFEEKKKQILG